MRERILLDGVKFCWWTQGRRTPAGLGKTWLSAIKTGRKVRVDWMEMGFWRLNKVCTSYVKRTELLHLLPLEVVSDFLKTRCISPNPYTPLHPHSTTLYHALLLLPLLHLSLHCWLHFLVHFITSGCFYFSWLACWWLWLFSGYSFRTYFLAFLCW